MPNRSLTLRLDLRAESRGAVVAPLELELSGASGPRIEPVTIGPRDRRELRRLVDALRTAHSAILSSIEVKFVETLRKALAQEGAAPSLAGRLAELRRSAGYDIRLELRDAGGADAELGWPWELWHVDAGLPLFAAEGADDDDLPWSLVRVVDASKTATPSAASPFLRLVPVRGGLAHIDGTSERGGDATLDERGWEREVAEFAHGKGDVLAHSALAPESPEELARQLGSLAEGPLWLAWFGHSDRHSDGTRGLRLGLGAGAVFPVAEVAEALARSGRSELVLLGACRGDEGLAAALVAAGVPHVVAYGRGVLGAFVKDFTRELLDVLHRGGPVDRALRDLRFSSRMNRLAVDSWAAQVWSSAPDRAPLAAVDASAVEHYAARLARERPSGRAELGARIDAALEASPVARVEAPAGSGAQDDVGRWTRDALARGAVPLLLEAGDVPAAVSEESLARAWALRWAPAASGAPANPDLRARLERFALTSLRAGCATVVLEGLGRRFADLDLERRLVDVLLERLEGSVPIALVTRPGVTRRGAPVQATAAALENCPSLATLDAGLARRRRFAERVSREIVDPIEAANALASSLLAHVPGAPRVVERMALLDHAGGAPMPVASWVDLAEHAAKQIGASVDPAAMTSEAFAAGLLECHEGRARWMSASFATALALADVVRSIASDAEALRAEMRALARACPGFAAPLFAWVRTHDSEVALARRLALARAVEGIEDDVVAFECVRLTSEALEPGHPGQRPAAALAQRVVFAARRLPRDRAIVAARMDVLLEALERALPNAPAPVSAEAYLALAQAATASKASVAAVRQSIERPEVAARLATGDAARMLRRARTLVAGG